MKTADAGRLWWRCAAIYGASAVLAGAFGAHALRGRLDAAALAIYHTGVEYQFYHALALLAVAMFAARDENRALRLAGGCFVLGVPLFSGSLYALAAGAPRLLGVVTPCGGLLLVAGWLALLRAAFVPSRVAG